MLPLENVFGDRLNVTVLRLLAQVAGGVSGRALGSLRRIRALPAPPRRGAPSPAGRATAGAGAPEPVA